MGLSEGSGLGFLGFCFFEVIHYNVYAFFVARDSLLEDVEGSGDNIQLRNNFL